MGSFLSPSSLFISINNHHYNLRRCDVSSAFGSSNTLLNFNLSKNRRVGLSASISERKLEASWLPSDGNLKDDYGGWAIIETQIDEKKKKKNKGFLRFLLVGAGASVAIILASITYSSLSEKGFRFRFNSPLHALRMTFDVIPSQRGVIVSDESNVDSMVSETIPDLVSDETNEIDASVSFKKLERVIIPISADSTQQEALQNLKKLKIIEDDVKGDKLCTKREYARWLVKANSVLERSPKHWIIPSKVLAGSAAQAFDDVSIEDPDFWSIQALAEAGIVPSKLSAKNPSFSELNGLKDEGRVEFFPESFIYRLDLLNWKAQLEYSSFPGIEEKMSRKKVFFMDMRVINSDATSELFMDMQAGDMSILRKVFGQSRRFQPYKPVTKAQAAVALTGGRMAKAISIELSRLEAENSSRLAEMEEIRSELLLKGEIQRFWEEKLNEVKAHGSEVARRLREATQDLEQEKNLLDKSFTEYLREKATLDCQRQLLVSLKEEVNEMTERLVSERANIAAERQNLEDMSIDLQAKQEGMIEAKSILGAEKEALRILRSWIEDEARRNQARAKVLEEVGRRWKWNGEA